MNFLNHLESCGVDLRATGQSDEWLAICPDCGRQKLAFNSDSGRWRCFICGTGGGFRKLCKALKIKQPSDGPADIASLRQSLERKPPPERPMRPGGLPAGFKPITQCSGAVALKAAEFLASRKISADDADLWNLGLCSDPDYFGYLIFPLTDLDGNVVSFQGRQVVGSGMKSKNPGDDGVYLHNLHLARGYRGLVVVEGPVDSIITHRLLSPGGISGSALLGHTCSATQAAIIARQLRPDIIWVAMDPDVTDREMHAVGAALRGEGAPDVRIAHLDRDPKKMDLDDFQDALEAAEPSRL